MTQLKLVISTNPHGGRNRTSDIKVLAFYRTDPKAEWIPIVEQSLAQIIRINGFNLKTDWVLETDEHGRIYHDCDEPVMKDFLDVQETIKAGKLRVIKGGKK